MQVSGNTNAMTSISNWMNNNANNVANVNTEGYKSTQTTISNSEGSIVAQSSKTENGTDLAKELTDQISIEKSLEANVKAVQTQDTMVGSLLDLTI